MKRHIISTLLFAVPVLLQSQVPTQNYVKSTQMLDGGQSLSTIQYYDGLGRPFEKVLQGVTPSHSNLVYLTEYDGWGRESRQWLPAVSSQIFMEPSSVASAVASSHGNDTHAYMENHYDGSPLNRIVAQDLEGAEWVGHPVKTEYLTNNQQMPLACIDYSVSGNALQTGSFYATGTLQVIKTTDVAGNVCYIFTDMQKHKVLERRMDGNSAHNTYYVYDQRGDLRYVPMCCSQCINKRPALRSTPFSTNTMTAITSLRSGCQDVIPYAMPTTVPTGSYFRRTEDSAAAARPPSCSTTSTTAWYSRASATAQHYLTSALPS